MGNCKRKNRAIKWALETGSEWGAVVVEESIINDKHIYLLVKQF